MKKFLAFIIPALILRAPALFMTLTPPPPAEAVTSPVIIRSATKTGTKLVVLNPSPLEGDTVIVSYKGKASEIALATFAGKPVSFFDYASGARLILPLAATERTGAHTLYVKFKDGSVATRTVWVAKKKFPLVDLGVPDKLGETPDEAVAGLAKTNAGLADIWKNTTTTADFGSGFIMPLRSFTRYGAPFGELRKTGDNYVRHLGTDFTDPIGTPVYAVNSGRVVRAYLDSSYGNTIVVDHGAGIFSLYLHLNSMAVKEGDAVARGEKLGEVGETGYAFGPHLHFSMKISGVSVDPVRFIKSFK